MTMKRSLRWFTSYLSNRQQCVYINGEVSETRHVDLGATREYPKVLANKDTLLRTHCCSWCFLGVQTRGTQNECCVSILRKLGNIYCGHKMFLTKIRNIFCVPDTKVVSATNVARTGKRGNICVGNNVSATMCPRLPVSLDPFLFNVYINSLSTAVTRSELILYADDAVLMVAASTPQNLMVPFDINLT